MDEKYEEIVNALDSDELKSTFQSQAKNGILDKDLAFEVLLEWGQLLDYDFSDAATYYDLNQSELPPEEIRQNLDYNSFVSIFRKWLDKEFKVSAQVKNEVPVEPQQSPKDNNPYWFKSDQTQNTEQSDLKNHDALIRTIFETQEQKTQKVFKEYAMLADTGDCISKSDFPLLLKNLLYQQNASIYEKEGGSEDYFMRSNTYKNLQEILGDKEDELITFEKFREAAVHFLRGNPNLILLDSDRAEKRNEKSRSPKQGTKRNLEEELLEQIEHYQQLLQQSEAEIEKQILRNMITTLVRQLDLMRDNSVNETQINNTMQLQQKKQLQISFSGIVRPEKQSATQQETEIQKIDKKLKEIFIFFCKQQYVSGASYEFDRYSKEAQTLSLGMFIYFCKSFNLIEQKVRTAQEKNLLERKRRGEDVIIPKEQSTIIEQTKEEPRQQSLERIENLPRKNKYSNVPSKFEWWNDELKFEKYYNPNTNPLPMSIQKDMVFLSRIQIQNLFKRSAFGKDLDYEEFKCLLGFMANKMFTYNGERHPHAYQYLLEFIYISHPEEYRRRLIPIKIPFNCKEKMGFRQLPGHEHHQYKTHQLSEAEKEQLKMLKQEREQYLRDKLSENPNQSIRSIGSVPPQSQNYKAQQGRFLNGRIDLEREKISWAKLENLNPHDLSQQGKVFKPQDLIDDFEDEEDRFFLKEFSLDDASANRPKPEEVKQNLEKYGSYKPPKRPTEKINNHQSQPNLQINQNQRYKGDDVKGKYIQRANQIEKQQNTREQQLLAQINKQYKL